MIEPLLTRSQARDRRLGTVTPTHRPPGAAIVRQPIGRGDHSCGRRNDLVRGVLATDALIGTFAGHTMTRRCGRTSASCTTCWAAEPATGMSPSAGWAR